MIEKIRRLFEPYDIIVFNRDITNGTSDIYDLYTKNDFDWFGEIKTKITNDGHITMSAHTTYWCEMHSVLEGLMDIKTFNDSRCCPAFCYNPSQSDEMKIIRAFTWYLGNLGFKSPIFGSSYGSDEYSIRTMVLTNWLGQEKETFNLLVKNDGTGSISKTIGPASWMNVDFKNVDEMIGGINSILEPTLLIEASENINLNNKLNNLRNNNISMIDKFTQKDFKDTLKEALNKAINNLN